MTVLMDIQSRKFGIGDILSTAWKIFTSQISVMILVTLIVFVPINILVEFIPFKLLIEKFGLQGFRLSSNLIRIIYNWFGAVATLSIVYATNVYLHGEVSTYKQALRRGLSRWPTFVWTSIVAGIILILLTLLLIVPGVIWSVYYTFITYVVALRDLSGKAALDYSKAMVQGQWWRVLGVTLALGIIHYVLALLVGYLLSYLPDHFIIDVVFGPVISIGDAYFIVAGAVFFLNTDFLRNPPDQQVLPSEIVTA